MQDRKLYVRSQLIEAALTIGMIAGLLNLVRNIRYYGFIPLPFVYDTSDTFMDWYNPTYYANKGGAYSVYTSIYAPLSFVITKIFSTPGCYLNHPKDGRTCDPVPIIAILCFFVLCGVVAAIAFHRKDPKTWVYRSVCFAIGLPMLHALERGQLLMVGVIYFIVFFGDLAKTRRGWTSAAAIMINMKSYLLFPVLALAVRREWRLLELCGFATIGLYLVTLGIVGEGTPLELVHNLGVWFQAANSVVWDQINYSTTYNPFLLFDVRGYPVRDFIPQTYVDLANVFIRSEIVVTRLLCLACLALAWLYPRTVPFHRIGFFLLMQSFIKDNPGGYGHAFIAFLVLLEPWTNWRTGIAIVLTFVMSIPTDYMLVTVMQVPRDSWITARPVETFYGMTLGALVRPGLLIVITWSLAIDTIVAVHREMRLSRPLMRVAYRARTAAAA